MPNITPYIASASLRGALAVTLALVACNRADEPVQGPQVFAVQIKRRPTADGPLTDGFPKIDECYDFVDPAPTGEQYTSIEKLVMVEGRTPCAESDGWQAGWDSLYVFVDYAPLILDRSKPLDPPTVTLRIDGAEQPIQGGLSVPLSEQPECSEGGTECDKRSPFAYGEIALPASLPAGFLSVHVKAADDYFRDLSVAAIAPAEAKLFLAQTNPEAGEPVADRTQVQAIAVVPPTWSGSPAVTLVQSIDGIPLSAPVELATPIREGEAAVLRQVVRAPAKPGRQWAVLLRSGGATASAGGKLAELSLDLKIDDCDPAQAMCNACEVVGGLDKFLVTASVPGDSLPTEAFVEIRLGDEVEVSASAVPLNIVGPDNTREGQRLFDVPAVPGEELRACARVSANAEKCVCALIVSPRDIELDLASEIDALDFDPSQTLPARVATESELECRRLWLGVRARDLPVGATVQVTAGPGASFDGKSQATVTLDAPVEGGGARGQRLVTLTGDDPTVTAIDFFAAAGNQSSSLVLELARVYPSTATLLANPGAQLVDPNGSKQVSVTGVAYPPLASPGLGFAPGTRLFVHTSGVQDMQQLACGPTLTAAEMKCDPTSDPPSGGCKLAPLFVEPDDDGDFAFTIPAGLCISGTVTFELRSVGYDAGQEDKCVGERALTDDPIVIGATEVKFQ